LAWRNPASMATAAPVGAAGPAARTVHGPYCHWAAEYPRVKDTPRTTCAGYNGETSCRWTAAVRETITFAQRLTRHGNQVLESPPQRVSHRLELVHAVPAPAHHAMDRAPGQLRPAAARPVRPADPANPKPIKTLAGLTTYASGHRIDLTPKAKPPS
jgi:hypothetical protein